MFREVFVVTCCLVSFSCAESRAECMEYLANWCKNKNPNSGVSITSSNFNNNNFQVVCVSGQQGTTCTRNGEVWFSCPPQGDVLYEGKPLTEADEGVCQTKDFVVSHLTFNQTAFNEGMKHFNQQMTNLEQQMKDMRERLSGPRMFGNSWPFGRRHSEYDDDK